MTNFIFIRHAPIDRSAGIYIGALDVPILPDVKAPENFPAITADLFITSPKKRCLQTCKLLHIRPDQTDLRFAEQNFGEFEGRTYDDVWAETKSLPEWNFPHALTPPGGESFLDVCDRVKSALEEYQEKYPNKIICIVTHAGVIRAAQFALTGMSPKEALGFQVHYFEVIRLQSLPHRF